MLLPISSGILFLYHRSRGLGITSDVKSPPSGGRGAPSCGVWAQGRGSTTMDFCDAEWQGVCRSNSNSRLCSAALEPWWTGWQLGLNPPTAECSLPPCSVGKRTTQRRPWGGPGSHSRYEKESGQQPSPYPLPSHPGRAVAYRLFAWGRPVPRKQISGLGAHSVMGVAGNCTRSSTGDKAHGGGSLGHVWHGSRGGLLGVAPALEEAPKLCGWVSGRQQLTLHLLLCLNPPSPHLSVIKLHHRLHREMCHRGCCSDTVGAQSREPARFRKREHCVHTRKTERLPVSVGSSGPERPALPVRRPPWGQAEGLGPYPGESGRSRAALAVGGPSWACVAE